MPARRHRGRRRRACASRARSSRCCARRSSGAASGRPRRARTTSLGRPRPLDVAVALRALRDPGDAGALAAMAHSWFGVGTGDDAAIGRSAARLAEWDAALESPRRRRARPRDDRPASPPVGCCVGGSGERALTDVLHLFDVLAAMVPPDAGPTALLEALGELEEAAQSSGDDDVRSRRIDTDAPAIRLMSVHGAKGLEFDVVLCPFIQRTRADDTGPVIWHDRVAGRRLVDAGGGSEWVDESLAAPTRAGARRAGVERRGERVPPPPLRGAHEGAAPHRGVVAARLLDRRRAPRRAQRAAARPRRRTRPRAATARTSATAPTCYELGGERRARRAAIAPRRARRPGAARARRRRGARRPAWSPRTPPTARRLAPASELSVATIDRSLVERARRCSFSSLVATGHDEAGPSTRRSATRARTTRTTWDREMTRRPRRRGTERRPRSPATTHSGDCTARRSARPSTRRSRPRCAATAASTSTTPRPALSTRRCAATGSEPSTQAIGGLLAASGVAIAGGVAARRCAATTPRPSCASRCPSPTGVDLADGRPRAHDGRRHRSVRHVGARARRERPRRARSRRPRRLRRPRDDARRGRRGTTSSTTRPTSSTPASATRGPASSPRCARRTTRCRRPSTSSRCTGSCAGASRTTTPSATSATRTTSTCAACGPARDDGVCTWSPRPAAIAALSDVLAGTS